MRPAICWDAQVYAVSAVGGTALSYIMSPNPSVGASGELASLRVYDFSSYLSKVPDGIDGDLFV